MYPQAPGIEQRLADLEAQLDRLSLTLLHWRETQDHLQPIEQQLSHLTQQCAEILERWTATGERHAQAVGELEARLTGWNEVEARLQRDAAWRFQSLQRAIEHEWAALRRLHEEPAKQLRAQAESLTEIAVAAAGSAQTGLERAEARLATLETDLHQRMAELQTELHAAVAELRPRNDPAAALPSAAPWPLDEVTRLHHELREGGARNALALTDQATPVAAHDPATTTARVEPPGATRPDNGDSRWRAAAAVLAVAVAVAAAVAVSFYRQVGVFAARASAAQQQAEKVATAANQQLEATRQQAAEQIAQARETAIRAQTTGDVLAAPDLVRYNLVGGGASRFSAQLLWSRSRGIVFSASRLPAPAAGSVYQIWLLTTADAVSAGTFTPDASGRATLATNSPPNVPRPVTAVTVTVEPAPGAAAPSGTAILARAQP